MSKKIIKQQSMVLEEDLFVPKVMIVPLPQNFEQLKMEKDDGSSDLVDHLGPFFDLMRLLVTTDDIMCTTFLLTLSSKRGKKTTIGLIQLTQDKEELLKDSIAPFNRATLEIKDLQ
ncbi:Uncharacterized protein Adt_22186 [Abeliophyllum distichum]|uniref:Uncharacterized protein n=1 Tax=Abeliophyllum distichum TaxID=126358 RepID=A0ABD1T1G3_9LAMI